MEDSYYKELVDELRSKKGECEWVEFKDSNASPELLGQYISALSNEAAIAGKECGYLVWGIQDGEKHDVIGTSFNILEARKSGELLLNWINRLLSPNLALRPYRFFYSEGKPVSLLEIPAAFYEPTCFENMSYYRVGSSLKKKQDVPAREVELFSAIRGKSFETSLSKSHLKPEEVAALLDFNAYFRLKKISLPTSMDRIIESFLDEGFIVKDDAGSFSITNMGALLFANDFSSFPGLQEKGVRILKYSSNSRTSTIGDETFSKGYAASFEDILRFLRGVIPQVEKIEGGLRKTFPLFPEEALREMLGNLIIHQDYSHLGIQSLIEVFPFRIEMTTPGKPLIDPARFIDTVTHCRNEKMAAFLRSVTICEQRSSGFDRIEEAMAEIKEPSPVFVAENDYSRTIIRHYENRKDWSEEDRINTCYVLSCYNEVNDKLTSNEDVRTRLNFSSKEAATISRLLIRCVEKGLLKYAGTQNSNRYRRYRPFWA
ncbi:MAG: putative DNA binding domain-containing protein [Bacilli bacterium]|jgi:ATP-dependent DNA helicase RecG|nr:putative DNA binding domain-containing protein [Bacilli bacterium]